MSEQTTQDSLYSVPVKMDKFICRSFGATTIKDLIKNKEISGISLKDASGVKTNKPDVLILNSDKQVVVFIEMKLPGAFSTKKDREKAKKQELDVAKKIKSKIYVISDGDVFLWFNPLTGNQILNENGSPVTRKINPKDLSDEENHKLADFIDDVCYCLSDSNDQLIEKQYIDPTPLAKKTARILQNMSLSTAKNSLYTFVEIFTFKFLSDINVLKSIYGFDFIYDVYQKNGGRTAFNQYLTTVRKQLLQLFPPGSDNTTIINGRLFHTQVDEMGNPIITDGAADCFGKLLDCFHEYEEEYGKFLYINKDFKSKLFETFMKNSSDKEGMGQFFTPLKIVQEMVRMVDIHEEMSICDPACGVGKFLLEASLKISNPFYFENGVLKSKIKLCGLEKRMEDNNDDLTAILAKSNFLIYYSDLFKNNSDSNEKITILSKELLNETIHSSQTTLGTLDKLVPNKWDLILANPPYYQSAVITEAAKSVKIDGTDTPAYTTGGRGIESLFTEWIIKSLKKGGVANVILPDGIFTNIANGNLKAFIIETCFIDSVISLPVGAFFNTPKKTYILTLHKRTDDQLGKKQSYPVFCYICSSIGETLDSYRFDIDDNDLHNAVDLYKLYKSAKSNSVVVKAIDDDLRAKLIDIDKFNPDEDWNIERFWSDNIKEELGIKKKDNSMSISEFSGNTEDLIDNIKEYREMMLELQDDLNSSKNETKYVEVHPYDLFEPKNGKSQYTRTWCKDNHGEYPIYSGNTDGAYDYINRYDYDGEYLTWTKDGLAGYMMLLNGKFSLTSHRGILIPKRKLKNIDLKYIYYVLEPIFRRRKKGRLADGEKNEYTTLNPDMIKKMQDTISIPVLDNGDYDFAKQNELASKYDQIRKIQDELRKQTDALTHTMIL